MAFNHYNLIDITELSRDDIMTVIHTAEAMKEVNQREIKQLPTLRGRTAVNLFTEHSTRTRSSFTLAEQRLSCSVLAVSGSSSSMTKGESLTDTIQTLNSYNIDLVVMRNSYAGSSVKVAQHTKAHVISAGEGKHVHPTQALLDLYTMWRKLGRLEGLHVGFVGDVSHSRVCGSLIPALKIMGADVTVIGPQTLLPDDPSVLGIDHVSEHLEEVLPDLDVIYTLRIQLERLETAPFPSLREYNMLYGITEERERLMRPDAVIMHPGPLNRGVEIDSYIADHPKRSLVLDQVFSGLCVRMAVIYLLMGGNDNGVVA